MVAPTVQHAPRILGVDAGAPFADVRRAYRQLLFACHPDRNPSDTAELCAARVRQICLAFEIVTANRNGAAAEQLGRRLQRVAAEIDALLIDGCRTRTLAAARPDARFMPASAHSGQCLDIAA